MLSIVCPVYNESENIGRLLDEIQRRVSVPAEMIVVYDFEEDTTLPVLRERSKSFPISISLCRNRYGRGVLAAMKTGLESACTQTAVVIIMADLSDDLSQLNHMYELIDDGTYDVVCGSRYMPGGKQIGGPLLKRTLSRLAGVSLHFLAGLPTHDATNNFKMYRGSFVAGTTIESAAGFELGLELVVKAYRKGYRIGEIPTIWRDRVAGKSRFKLASWLPHYLRWYGYAFAGPKGPR